MEIAQQDRDTAAFERAPRPKPKTRPASSAALGHAAAVFGADGSDGGEDSDEDAAAATRLPIKVGRKLVKAPRRLETPTDAASAGARSEGDGSSGSTNASSGSSAAGGANSGAVNGKPDVLRGAELERAMKLEMSRLATEILAEPEKSTKQLRELRELCSHEDLTVCKLAILSLATVFKDVIPGYRIRELTDKEKSAVVSEAVKQARDYDASLVRNYQMFLQRLHGAVKRAGEVCHGHHAHISCDFHSFFSHDPLSLLSVIICQSDGS